MNRTTMAALVSLLLLVLAASLWWSPFALGRDPSINEAPPRSIDEPVGGQTSETTPATLTPDRSELATAPSSKVPPNWNRQLIFGRVIRGADGSPLPGAIVVLERRAADHQWLSRDYGVGIREVAETTSGSDGRFSIRVNRPDTYRLRVSAPGYGVERRAGILGGVEIVVPMQKSATLHVTVTAEGKPVAAASVQLQADSIELAAARTATDGSCRLANLPPGKAWLKVLAAGLTSGWSGVDLKSGQDTRLNVKLRPGRQIRGVVRREDTGHPIAGAEISDSMEFSRIVRSDENGRFRFRGLSKTVWLYVRATGFARKNHHAPAANPGDVEIAMKPCGVVIGRIVDDNGNPPEHVFCSAIVRFVEISGRSMLDAFDCLTGEVDAAGYFQIFELRPDRRYSILVSGRGYGARLYPLPGKIDSGTRHDMGTLILRPEALIAGRVIGGDGKPRANQGLVLQPSLPNARAKTPRSIASLGRRRTTSDSLGRFSFGGIAAGKYVISARVAGAAQTFKTIIIVADGEQHIEAEIVMTPGLTIAGRLHLPGGQRPGSQDLGDLRLRLLAFRHRKYAARSTTDATGRFRFEGLEPGSYDIKVLRHTGDKSWILRPVHDVPSGTMDLQLNLERSLTISGRVTDNQGKPCRASVRAVPDDAKLQQAGSASLWTGEDGKFEIHVVEDFVGKLIATTGMSPKARPDMATVEGIRGGQNNLHLRLQPSR